jgi:hypothetical protein
MKDKGSRVVNVVHARGKSGIRLIMNKSILPIHNHCGQKSRAVLCYGANKFRDLAF